VQMIDTDTIGKELIQRGWSQGSLLQLKSASRLYLALENPPQEDMIWQTRQEPVIDSDLFVIISQPCDIQKSPSQESYVEVMPVFTTAERRIIHEASRNSVRYFLLRGMADQDTGALIVESTIRLTLDKSSLLFLTPYLQIQDKVTLRLFARWLARRYERPALENDLVDAIQRPIVKAIGKLKTTHSLQTTLDGIGEVLFLLKNENRPYQVELIFMRSERSDVPHISDEQAAELAGWMGTVLDKGGSASLKNWHILGTDQISLRDYTSAYTLPLDQYSLLLDEANE
jgi:hypothetical protein